jgi:hypothetical protein
MGCSCWVVVQGYSEQQGALVAAGGEKVSPVLWCCRCAVSSDSVQSFEQCFFVESLFERLLRLRLCAAEGRVEAACCSCARYQVMTAWERVDVDHPDVDHDTASLHPCHWLLICFGSAVTLSGGDVDMTYLFAAYIQRSTDPYDCPQAGG